MKQGWKRLAAALAALLLAATGAAGETLRPEDFTVSPEDPESQGTPGSPEEAESGVRWQFDEKGFLTGENPGEAYLLEDEENGIWQYSTADLSIRVNRFEEEADKNHRRVYCVAEVYATEKSPLFTILTPAEKKKAAGYKLVYPEKLVAANPVALAVSDDYYGYRHQRILKGATWPVGIILRNGEILYQKTRNSAKKRPFPPLDTLAVYADGSMKTRICDEMTAEEYLADGAVQVFSFGPWLIRNGEINEQEAGSKAVYLNYSEPRTAVGMVEPYHYILIVVGVPSNKYLGAKGSWLIAKMQEYGCVEALNLDGGGTASMVFNGKVIIQGRGKKQRRPLGSMIAFGPLGE